MSSSCFRVLFSEPDTLFTRYYFIVFKVSMFVFFLLSFSFTRTIFHQFIHQLFFQHHTPPPPPGCLKQLWRKITHKRTYSQQRMAWKSSLKSQKNQWWNSSHKWIGLCHRSHKKLKSPRSHPVPYHLEKGHLSTIVWSPGRPKEKMQNNMRKTEWASMSNTLKTILSCPFRSW